MGPQPPEKGGTRPPTRRAPGKHPSGTPLPDRPQVAPALAAGCSAVLKPSPLASLSCLRLGEMAAEAGVADGALAVLTGGPPSGEVRHSAAARLLDHPSIDRLSFTGSGRGGGAVLHACADALRPAHLELGGKGSLVVFDDADLAAAADWAVHGIFACAGQVCSATSRLLVHVSVADQLVDALVASARAIRVGDPQSERTQMGPLVSAAQRDNVLSAIRTAEAAGARVLCGGSDAPADVPAELGGGYYVAPTILADSTGIPEVWRAEIFGPVLCVATFESEEEAVRLANDTEYGLGHAVMSADGERCERVARALDAGTVWVNCNQALTPCTPFGGWKASGFGKECGEAGLLEYVRWKTVTAAPHGFAYGGFNE